ncbi:hypothetical protein PanWU01x14_261870 [Parasponia andersonii]|uniref:Uncharacterized protein n=1 Tax=Parasponia andersonii TaxID=3476 RepID=A0A2P5B8C2_PARAD|nr:hypothetical protein PanWU01x14_261870 [Parasponia andersonii]
MVNSTACKHHCMRMRLNAINYILICFHNTNKLPTLFLPNEYSATVGPAHHIVTIRPKEIHTFHCLTIPMPFVSLRRNLFINIHS